MKTIEEIKAMKPEERSPEEQAALDAAERKSDNNDFPKSWDEVFNHPRFKELNKRAKDAETTLQQLQNERETEKQNALKEQGKWKEIAEENERKLKEAQLQLGRLNEYETTLKETLDAQLSEIPVELQKLVPDTLDTRGQLAWLSKNKPILLKPNTFDIGAGGNLNAGGKGRKQVEISDEQKELARRYGMSPEDYVKFSGDLQQEANQS